MIVDEETIRKKFAVEECKELCDEMVAKAVVAKVVELEVAMI